MESLEKMSIKLYDKTILSKITNNDIGNYTNCLNYLPICYREYVKLHEQEMMNKWENKILSSLAQDIDRIILADIQTTADSHNKGYTAGVKSAGYNLGSTDEAIFISKDNAVEKLIDIIHVQREHNINPSYILVPSWYAWKANIEKLENIPVYESNDMTPLTDTAGNRCWYVIAGHKSAIYFNTTIYKLRNINEEIILSSISEFKVLKPEYLCAMLCKPVG